MVAIVLTYAVYKFILLENQSQYNTLQEVVDYHFEPSDSFGISGGFAVAAAVSSYDGNPLSIEDEEIGQVKFFIKSW